jgi:hypothetical protein
MMLFLDELFTVAAVGLCLTLALLESDVRETTVRIFSCSFRLT